MGVRNLDPDAHQQKNIFSLLVGNLRMHSSVSFEHHNKAQTKDQKKTLKMN
jgi:hypothetical protein